MDKKSLCLGTVLTLVMAAGAIAIGYTNFVQAEIKEDIQNLKTDVKDDLADMKTQELIDREKINSVQMQVSAIAGDIKVLLERTLP